jgi:hypothetical protein
MPFSRFFRIFSILSILFVVFVWKLSPAQAFDFSPVIVDIVVAPGASQSGEIRVTNTADETQVYAVSIQKFVAQGENGQQDFLPESDISGLASWIKPENTSLTLKSGQKDSFSYMVRVPQDAEPGGHYAALFFSRATSNDGSEAVGVSAKTGVLFLVRVSGQVSEAASIESFQVIGGRLSSLPAQFELRVRNTGNTHLHPQGEIVIRNMFGNVVAKVVANPNDSAVLPNGIRRYDPVWVKHAESASGFLSSVKDEWHNFAIGRYVAEAQLQYGDANIPLKATTVFWVFPWRLVLMSFGLIVILLILRKLYNQSVIRSATRPRR